MTTQAIEAEVVERKETALAARHVALEERSVEDVLAQVQKIQQLMASALKDGEHYGVIPGTGGNDPTKPPKKTLLQPGAQKLCFMFRLIPEYVITRNDLENDHREYEVRCELIHSASGTSCGQGVGSCSTKESKYRWRKAERTCPACGAETIKRSKFEENGEKGWYCYGKIGGCGEKYGADDARIVSQETGRKENPDIADTYNTVLKMAKKRAFVDATITATAAGDIFTQDLEDSVASEPETQAPVEKVITPKLITKGQQNLLWTHSMKRADETGSMREQIMRDVLVFLKIEKTADIPATEFERVVRLIEQWDPELKVGEEEMI